MKKPRQPAPKVKFVRRTWTNYAYIGSPGIVPIDIYTVGGVAYAMPLGPLDGIVVDGETGEPLQAGPECDELREILEEFRAGTPPAPWNGGGG